MKLVVNENLIKVQGKVQDKIIKNLSGDKLDDDKTAQWFFVDYSSSDYPLKSKFDLLVSTNLLITKTDIILEAVSDSFGNKLEDGIPKGFKTVVKFLFPYGIPSQLQNLPVSKGWSSTGNEIWLSVIEDMKLEGVDETFDLSNQFIVNDFYKIILFDLRKEGSNPHQIDKEVFFNYFRQRQIADFDKFLHLFIQQGFIKETNENVLNFQLVD